MKIALDISPMADPQHSVRGVGAYVNNLKEAFDKQDSHEFFFAKSVKDIPSDADLLHIPYFDPYHITLPFVKKRKTVVTIHDFMPIKFQEHFPPGIKGKTRWKIQKRLLRKIDAVITDSMASKKDIAEYSGISEDKIHVVYLAANSGFGVLDIKSKGDAPLHSRIKDLKEQYNIPEKFALYVGDVTWNKNLPRVLRALDGSGISVILVGKALVREDYDRGNPWNTDRVAVQELIKKSKNISAIGFVSDDALVALYNLATVFVMPSIYEGFGLPILEAMQCGAPVVTSREGSIPEVAGEAAYFVDAYDENDIRKGVEKVFGDDNLRKRMREKGLLQSKKFNWEKTASQTLEAYEEVIGS